MADKKETFPNIPVSHWFSLRNQFKKSIPGNISSNYVASILGMTEVSAKTNIIPSLRLIGLIDTEGKTNQELTKQLRDDSSYSNFCQTILQKVYPRELRDAFPDKDANKERVKSWFMNHTGVGDSGAGRMVTFYIAMLEADPNNQKTNTLKANGVKAKAVTTKATTPKKKEQPAPIVEERQTFQSQPTQSHPTQNKIGPEVNINIQIHISSDASPDQIKSIFENMAKYIYKS